MFTAGSTKGAKNVNWKGGRPIITCDTCAKQFEGVLYRKSRYCSRVCCGKSKVGKPSAIKGRKMASGEKSATWKGEDAKPDAKHKWVRVHFPHDGKCEHCKEQFDNLDLAVKENGKYTKKRADYLYLCRACHRRYDGSYLNLHPHLRSTRERHSHRQ